MFNCKCVLRFHISWPESRATLTAMFQNEMRVTERESEKSRGRERVSRRVSV